MLGGATRVLAGRRGCWAVGRRLASAAAPRPPRLPPVGLLTRPPTACAARRALPRQDGRGGCRQCAPPVQNDRDGEHAGAPLRCPCHLCPLLCLGCRWLLLVARCRARLAPRAARQAPPPPNWAQLFRRAPSRRRCSRLHRRRRLPFGPPLIPCTPTVTDCSDPNNSKYYMVVVQATDCYFLAVSFAILCWLAGWWPSRVGAASGPPTALLAHPPPQAPCVPPSLHPGSTRRA